MRTRIRPGRPAGDRQVIATLRRHIRALAARTGVAVSPGTAVARGLAVALFLATVAGSLAASASVTPQRPPAATPSASAAPPVDPAERGAERAARSSRRTRLGAVPPPNAVTRKKPKPKPAWVKPASEYHLTSGYGHRWGTLHAGVDLAGPTGTPIRAAHSGTVEVASWYGGYGYAVVVKHGNGVSTLYGHNSRLMVHEGQRVSAGQRIALMGSTGDSTGPHLHFEIHLREEPVDPLPWLRRRGVQL